MIHIFGILLNIMYLYDIPFAFNKDRKDDKPAQDFCAVYGDQILQNNQTATAKLYVEQ